MVQIHVFLNIFFWTEQTQENSKVEIWLCFDSRPDQYLLKKVLKSGTGLKARGRFTISKHCKLKSLYKTQLKKNTTDLES